ncbi:hypothetical protein NIES2101_37390 [Calothrix sp. HK-06]|nr:hypothetical protein NIES2101_37390 [Calothrix sp. HK-06]
MPSEKPRVQIRFDEEDFGYLEDWAKSEFIPVTQLCRAIILKAVANRRKKGDEKSDRESA